VQRRNGGLEQIAGRYRPGARLLRRQPWAPGVLLEEAGSWAAIRVPRVVVPDAAEPERTRRDRPVCSARRV